MKQLLLMMVVTLYCAPSISQTVYDIEAVRPFQGEPPLQDSEQTKPAEPADESGDNKVSDQANGSASDSTDQGQAQSSAPSATLSKDRANASDQETDQAPDQETGQETAHETGQDLTQQGHGFIGEPTVVTSENANPSAQTETVVTARRIYQCRNSRGYVFVDEENKGKYSDCSMVREQEVITVVKEAPEVREHIDYCTGMIQFRGNTYVFDDKNPCPIPADVFQLLTPLEAQPAYYLNPPTQP